MKPGVTVKFTARSPESILVASGKIRILKVGTIKDDPSGETVIEGWHFECDPPVSDRERDYGHSVSLDELREVVKASS